MLPPSDSFLHQSHKEAEVLAELRGQLAAALSSPPPPYSSTVQVPPPHGRESATENRDENWSDVDDVDIESDDETYDSSLAGPMCRPVTVDIDASFCIVGHGNTIVLPSVAGGRGIGSANQPATTGALAEGQSIERRAFVPSPLSAAALLQSMQKQRQAKLSELATSIVSEIRQSNALASNDLGGGHTNTSTLPVHIKINTGVRIEGSKNVVYAGTAGRMLSRAKNAPARTNSNASSAGCSIGEGAIRKRRAQSVRVLTWTLVPNLSMS